MRQYKIQEAHAPSAAHTAYTLTHMVRSSRQCEVSIASVYLQTLSQRNVTATERVC